MDMFQIEGAKPLNGSVRVSGSKNTSLPLLMAALLAESPSVLEDVPDLRDIREMVRLMSHLGATVVREGTRLIIDPAGFNVDYVPYDIMRKMRASFYAMGPMLARLGHARVSLPGGCAIGDRPVDLHLRGFKGLGAQLGRSSGYVHARSVGRLKGSRFSLMGSNGTSVGATCNVMMAATLAEGVTIIDDAAREPEITELGNMLNAMGARVEGMGTSTLRIEGVERLHGCNWKVSFDRIEAATWAIAGLATHGDVTLENVGFKDMASTLRALEQWGAELTWVNESTLRVRRGKGMKRALSVVTEPFPGFPTDAQPQLTVLLALTPGESSIRDTIYPERFMQVPELNRLGARIKSPEKGRIEIHGVPVLEGAAVMASDLRAGAALVVAALAAHGTSQVRRIYHIERGYERIEEKIMGLGGSIVRLPETDADPGLDSVLFGEETTPLASETMVPTRAVS
ncbi:UDP-N-acetylglucosamine 1-carboxyvinyltransferase [bacterium]|nr:UDP-N-acetylglucosamine 1-carboxyvinyltransferase [bacterium]